MKSIATYLSKRPTRRTLRSLAFISSATLLLNLGLVDSGRNAAHAQQPTYNPLFEPANRVARFLGIGYSDGYHAAQNRSNCALLDLPPASAYHRQASQQIHGHALHPMPATAYTFGAPAWTATQHWNHQPLHSEVVSDPQNYPHSHAVEQTYQVPTYAPQTYGPMPNGPMTYGPSTGVDAVQSYPVQPMAPPNRSSTTAETKKVEDLPAPSPSSPSDLTADPPSSKITEESQAENFLQGLESLNEDTLEDPLMEDTNVDLDGLELELDDLSTPSSVDTDSLLNIRYQTNPFLKNPRPSALPAANGYFPQQAQHTRLTAPQPQRFQPTDASRISEKSDAATPAVSRVPSIDPHKTPRTARLIYEPHH